MKLWVKGVPMLELGSALEDETLTIRFVTLENPENFGRKYPAAHPDEITAILSFFDSGHKMVTFRPLRNKLTLIDVYSYMRQVISFHLVYRKLLKKHHKILYWFFSVKKRDFLTWFFSKFVENPLVIISYSDLANILIIFMIYNIIKT